MRCPRAIFPPLSLLLALAPATPTPPARGADAPAAVVTVRPEPIDDLLANPGMGWQTFDRFADEDRNLAGLPSTSAYFRLYWRDLEPQQGKLDSGKITDLLARARRSGQRLSLRVMCAGTEPDQESYVPDWLRDAGCRGSEFRYEGGGRTYWMPDLTDPLFQRAHLRFIRQLGRRCDGLLDLLDVGSVGLWGEWHVSGTGLELPDDPTLFRYIDAWCDAFPDTPKAMLIGHAAGLKHAFAKGCGWRADCLGDMGGFSKNWSHMRDVYPQRLRETGAEDVWKTAPVALEDCWDMRKWKEEGWDARAIFDWALSVHVSYVNNKSAPLPEGARPEVERLLRRLGYRLVLSELSHPPALVRGEPGTIRATWDNRGVAPPYRDYVIAWRLTARDAKGAARNAGGVAPLVLATKDSVKGWLPGKHETAASVVVPKSLPAGWYELSVALREPESDGPAIRLAIAGRGGDGWYAVSAVEVR